MGRAKMISRAVEIFRVMDGDGHMSLYIHLNIQNVQPPE